MDHVDIAIGQKPKTVAPNQRDWMLNVMDAAGELGYGVEMLTPGSIRMSDRAHTITVETIFLSGDTLRALVRSRREP